MSGEGSHDDIRTGEGTTPHTGSWGYTDCPADCYRRCLLMLPAKMQDSKEGPLLGSIPAY